tara:strand:- start:5946 stop:6239 length:294 start_codon:yes stop_codon:yes gene_type:complete
MVSGCNTSGVLNSTKLVHVGRVRIASVKVFTTGNTVGSITVYDSNTATTTGKKIITKMYVGASTTPHNYDFDFHGAIVAEGIYVVEAGALEYSVEFF